MASIVDFSALLSAFPDRDLAKVSVQEFVKRLSHPHDPHQKGNLKIGDEQRLLQLDILLCAGLCLGEETINGHEVTIGNPREAVKDLLTSIFGKPVAVLEVLKSRPKLSDVQEACCRLPVLFLLENAALRQRLDLKTKLKTAEACRMSTCDGKSQSHLECMKTWKDIDEILRRIGEDLSSAEKDEKIQLVNCMEVEVVGFHYYTIFLYLQFTLRIHMTLHENNKNTFEFVLDTCEAAYSKLEKELQTNKAPKRKGAPLLEPTDKKIRANFKPQQFKCINYIADKKMHDLTRDKSFTDQLPREVVQREKQFQSEGKWIDGDKMIRVRDDGELDVDIERVRLAWEKYDPILDDQERRQADLQRKIEQYDQLYIKELRIIKSHRENNERLTDELESTKKAEQRLKAELARERNSDKTELSAKVISLQKSLREKEETIELQRKQNEAESERLHGQLTTLRTDHDHVESQLREEREGRLRDNENATREKLRVEQRLEAEKASLADQFSAQLIALQKTLREKEETIELQQKKHDEDSNKLHGELTNLQADRDELACQLRDERQGRHSLQAEVASLSDQLEKENCDKKELSAELVVLQKTVIEKEETIELRQKQANEDLEKLDGEVRKLRTDRDDLGRQLHEERELQHKERQDAARERSNAVQRLQKQLEDMKERHRIETNRLKADVVAEAAALKRQRDKLYEDAQKRLAENSQVEQLSDPNRPSEVAKRYSDLFQHTYDVAEVLETEKDVEEDECNSFVVEMLMISSRAAESSLSEYETANAKANGLNESFLKKNPTAKRILKESVTSLLRLASAASREENSKRITEIALREIQESYPKYYSQETAPTIEKFVSSSSSVVWEVVIFARPADFVLNDTTFDEAVHERFCGSNPKSDKIRFIVWPRLAEQVTGKTLCKGKVMTGE